jgi:hypothetical protein
MHLLHQAWNGYLHSFTRQVMLATGSAVLAPAGSSTAPASHAVALSTQDALLSTSSYLRHVLPAVAVAWRQLQQLLKLWHLLPVITQPLVTGTSVLQVQL